MPQPYPVTHRPHHPEFGWRRGEKASDAHDLFFSRKNLRFHICQFARFRERKFAGFTDFVAFVAASRKSAGLLVEIMTALSRGAATATG